MMFVKIYQQVKKINVYLNDTFLIGFCFYYCL